MINSDQDGHLCHSYWNSQPIHLLHSGIKGPGSAAAPSGPALDTSSWDLTLHRTVSAGLLDPALSTPSCKHAGPLVI